MRNKFNRFRTVRGLLSTPNRWIKNAYARDSRGFNVDPECGDAVRFCLIGACKRVYPDYNQQQAVINTLHKTIQRHAEIFGIANFNDHPSTTFAKVRKIVRLAGI